MLSAPTLAQLKEVDPDRCRAAVFGAKVQREALELLYAFHYELAKVPELVSEPMIGQIRYQWWRDALAEIYERRAVRQHEIATPLAALLTSRDIPRFWCDQLIDGRERDLDSTPFGSLAEAKGYCRQTSGVLMQIAVKVLGAEPNEAVLDLGESWGLTGLARSYGYYDKGMLSLIDYRDICQEAARQYETAQAGLGELQSQAFPALAYGALISKYLKKLTHKSHDPASQMVSYSPLAKRLDLLGAVIKGKV